MKSLSIVLLCLLISSCGHRMEIDIRSEMYEAHYWYQRGDSKLALKHIESAIKLASGLGFSDWTLVELYDDAGL